MPHAQKDEFDKIAPEFLKTLKAKNESLRGSWGILDSVELRRLLSSAEYAKWRAPKISQTTWMELIVKMIQRAKNQGLQTEVFSAMLRTRDDTRPLEIKLDDGPQ